MNELLSPFAVRVLSIKRSASAAKCSAHKRKKGALVLTGHGPRRNTVIGCTAMSDETVILQFNGSWIHVHIRSSMIHMVTEEFENIQTWAAKNNLKIHPNKTKEMLIFRRRTSRAKYSSEPIIFGAERVEALRVLGVTLTLPWVIT